MLILINLQFSFLCPCLDLREEKCILGNVGGCGTLVPVEVSLDSLLDQPQRMMGLVVEVAAHHGQHPWRDVGEVVAGIGMTQHLHGVLANQRLRAGAFCAQAPSIGQTAAPGQGLQEGAEPGKGTVAGYHDDWSMELGRQ